MKASTAFADGAVTAAQTLDGLVACLGTTDGELLTCQLQDLGRQYQACLPRVRPEHWKHVSQAMVGALGDVLGETARWDTECRESWETTLEMLSTRTVQIVKEQQQQQQQ